ncbi:MAG: phenylalanine--tRNA ligase subunit alpha [Alphaproteobacteria bacterium]|jgi:phenylalanyl-tRNA synthetase alpha chain|nr:phenylalanine--tRNA ligase subunit alpha [Alphaproteobacteria bacterium]
MDIHQVLKEATKAIESCNSQQQLQDVKVAYLGKKGKITGLLKLLKDFTLEEKKSKGAEINSIKAEVEVSIEKKLSVLKNQEINSRLSKEFLDISFPPLSQVEAKVHPISKTFDEVISIFGSMGYSVAEGPDIETDFYNFTALNIPEDHPAREMQDTFYIEDKDENGLPMVLRTHTSPVQIRTMINQKPPIKIIAPGRTYRCDSDSTHSPMFHQVEGLFINESANMSDLKGTLIEFCKKFFEVHNLKVRFRPSYFPFTEPSAEMDIAYSITNNELRIGEGDKWLEILGCGMVNPIVLENCKIDSSVFQGFAFGVGLDRITMLKHGLKDIRAFFSGNINWTSKSGFGLGDY